MEVVILKITLEGSHRVSDAQTVRQVGDVVRSAYPGKTVDVYETESRIILTARAYGVKIANELHTFAQKTYTKLRRQ